MLLNCPLGQKSLYLETYSPDLLFPILRALGREKISLPDPLPFDGVDLWNGYELSWLNLKGKPEIALAQFTFPCNSSFIVESKSFKLYLNSFNQSHFESMESVQKIIQKDLSSVIQAPVEVKVFTPSDEKHLKDLPGFCLDRLDIEINEYQVNPELLSILPENVEETLYSNLLKSNCLATGQPDWGSLWIHYKGKKINHEGLLKYIISFRKHSGFGEHCGEQIFWDIWNRCQPEKLSIYVRYTRRGGLDINSFRSNFESIPFNGRQPRQ